MGGCIAIVNSIAGCSQGSGDSLDDQGTPTDSAETDQSSPSPSESEQYPPGMTDSGISDARELSRAHHSELLETTFTVAHHYQRRVMTPEGSLDHQVNSIEYAQIDGETALRTVYEVSGDVSVAPIRSGGRHTDYDHEQYAKDGTLYEYRNETREVTERSTQRPSTEYTFYGSISGRFSDVPISKVESNDGKSLFWVGETRDVPLRKDGYSLRRIHGTVRETGIVEHFSELWKKQRPSAKGVDVVKSSITFSRIDGTRINPPGWL